MLSPEIEFAQKNSIFIPSYSTVMLSLNSQHTPVQNMAFTVLVEVQGRAPSEITGLYKYLCKRFSLPSLLKTHKPEKNTAPSPHVQCLRYVTVTYTLV